MNNLSMATLVPQLVGELGYSPHAADIVARELIEAAPRVRDVFFQWWETGKIAELEVEGYSVQRLMDERNMNPVAACLTLDWLIKEPEAALASLARGYDWVE